MEGLDPPAQHLGHAGDLGNLEVVDPGRLEDLRGPPARDELDAEAGEAGRERLEAGLVVDGQQRSHGSDATSEVLRRTPRGRRGAANRLGVQAPLGDLDALVQ